MNLYHISKDYLSQMDELLDLEIDEQTLIDTLDSISGDFDNKVIAIASFIKNCEGDLASISKAIDHLSSRKLSIQNRIKGLTEYVKYNMDSCKKTEVKHSLFDIKVVKNPPMVRIDNAKEIPEEYLNYSPVPPPLVNKALIKKHKGCAGATLVSSTRLQIK